MSPSGAYSNVRFGAKRSSLRSHFGAVCFSVQITTNTLRQFQRACVSALACMLVVSLTACEPGALVLPGSANRTTEEPPVTYRAHVVWITDGDTITVLDKTNQQHIIRLANVDAPERGQPWGDRSKQALSDLVFDRDVSIQPTDTDRYGRTIATVFGGGRDINRELVLVGAAWAYRRYLTDETLIATEAAARDRKVGLWSMSSAETVAPWDWRRGVRQGSATGTTSASSAHGAPRSLLASPVERTHPLPARSTASQQFSCGAKHYCREMSSCAEARFYLERCGVSTMDGDGDGQPCEQVCGH